MGKKQKKKVLLLYGGKSPEHDVSIQSAGFVIDSISRKDYNLVSVLINKKGEWIEQSSSEKITNIPKFLKNIDVVFPLIHGMYGEDGVLQGFLDMLDIPYVGPNVLAAALAMDKDIAKRLVRDAGFQVAPYVSINAAEWEHEIDACLEVVQEELLYPLFVKPANAGSSIGITKVEREDHLLPAIVNAFQYDTKILVEESLDAREIEVAVLGNSMSVRGIISSLPGEIKPKKEFYSYEAKYLDKDGADLMAPADLDVMQINEVRALACQIYQVLNGVGMARIDFLLDKKTTEFYFNEANTIPGFTAISMYPKLFAESGLKGAKLIESLIMIAFEQNQQKTAIRKTSLS